jgi:hypothetical protein
MPLSRSNGIARAACLRAFEEGGASLAAAQRFDEQLFAASSTRDARLLAAEVARRGDGWRVELPTRWAEQVARVWPSLDAPRDDDVTALAAMAPPEGRQRYIDGVRTLCARGSDREAFLRFGRALHDETAEEAARGSDVERAALAAHELPRSAFERVLARRAAEAGFGGITTADPSWGLMSAARFHGLLGEGLLFDPFFAVEEEATGPHGADAHVLQWLYLADADREAGTSVARDVYKLFGEPSPLAATTCDTLFETRELATRNEHYEAVDGTPPVPFSRIWAMTPEVLTPLLESLLPTY